MDTTNNHISSLFRIDLRKKSVVDAKKNMKRLINFKKEKDIKKGIYFLLPSYINKVNSYFLPEKISTSCPYCSSKLIETDSGTVCSNDKIKDVIYDIRQTKKRWGKKSDLFMSTKANRFLDQYNIMGSNTLCEYTRGNEEGKFRITNRLLVKNVDRKTIFSSKKR